MLTAYKCLARRIDRDSKNSVELVRRAGEIARLPFRVGHNDLVLGNAADEKALARGVERDPLRDELWILQAESYRGDRCRRFLVAELFANCLKLRVVPHCIEPGVARGDQPEFATLQTAQERERSIAVTKACTKQGLIEDQHPIARSLFPQSLNAFETCASRSLRLICGIGTGKNLDYHGEDGHHPHKACASMS